MRTIVWMYFPLAALWYLALCRVSLVQSYRHAGDATEPQPGQVDSLRSAFGGRWCRIGYSLYLTQFNENAFSARGAVTWPMFAASVCFTVAFTISITRYRLMQLDKIISSGVRYFLISFLAGLAVLRVWCSWACWSSTGQPG